MHKRNFIYILKQMRMAIKKKKSFNEFKNLRNKSTKEKRKVTIHIAKYQTGKYLPHM